MSSFPQFGAGRGRRPTNCRRRIAGRGSGRRRALTQAHLSQYQERSLHNYRDLERIRCGFARKYNSAVDKGRRVGESIAHRYLYGLQLRGRDSRHDNYSHRSATTGRSDSMRGAEWDVDSGVTIESRLKYEISEPDGCKRVRVAQAEPGAVLNFTPCCWRAGYDLRRRKRRDTLFWTPHKLGR
jgi:hypothetical protein